MSLLVLTACSEISERREDGATRRDSAGIVVVENVAAEWPERGAWQVGPDPLLSLGTPEGKPAEQFAGVADAARLSDGTIVVADGGSSEVRYFDAGGTHLATVGGAGQGPGEFGTIERIATTPGDTVWVYDYALRRFTVLDGRGALERTVSLERPPPALGFAGRFADGTLLMAQFWGVSQTAEALREGLRRDPAALVRFAPDGAQLDTVGRFPGREVHLALEGERMVMGSPLFGRTLSRAVAGDRLWVGDQESFQIGGYDPDGTPALVVRLFGVDLSITQDHLAAALDSRLDDVRPERRPGMRAFLLEAERPTSRPAYGEFRVDGGGRLWVAAFEAAGATPRTWYVFSRDGRWLGRVGMPAGFRLLQVGDGWVLGVARDEVDVEYVRLHPLRR